MVKPRQQFIRIVGIISKHTIAYVLESFTKKRRKHHIMPTDTKFQYTPDQTLSVGTMIYTISLDIRTASASSDSPTYTSSPSSSSTLRRIICQHIPGSESITCIPESASTSFTSDATFTGYNPNTDYEVMYKSDPSSPVSLAAITVASSVFGIVIVAILTCLYRRRSRAKKSRGILEPSEDNNELSVVQTSNGAREIRDGHVKGPYVNHTAWG
jgi:hypothetical protein